MTQALKNIRVVDLSRVLAGPFCTQIMGDLGADVIKIEKPGRGDDTRFWGPPYLQDDDEKDTTESAYYLSANRNKRSLTVDFTTSQGQEIIHKLLAESDVLIQNFKAGGLDKYGLGYDQVHKRHPHIVYTAITGFGQTGPLASEPGYDFLAQALGGLMASTGEPDGQPMKAGVALSDVMTGLYACIGTLAALNARHETGKGQFVDTALLDCTLASMTNLAQYYLTSGNVPPRLGNAHSTIVPYQTFATRDSYIVIAIGNDSQFKRFCEGIGQKDWPDDARFATNSARVTHRDELVPLIADVIATRPTEEWRQLFLDIDIPSAPVQKMDEVFGMDQIQARDMQIAMPHPARQNPVSLVGSPLKLSETPARYRHAPPTLGQHTEEILREVLSYDDAFISALREKNIV